MFSFSQNTLVRLVIICILSGMFTSSIVPITQRTKEISADSQLEGDSTAHVPLNKIGSFLPAQSDYYPREPRVSIDRTPKQVQAVSTTQPPKPKKQGAKKGVPSTPSEAPPVTVPASSRVETVIAFAMAQIGDPYHWAAQGPNSWDCSGLVMVAFSKVGIKLPRSTKSGLKSVGTQVSRGSLSKGDIVFPSSGHVGIYIGEGKILHAPQPGDVVKISKLWSFYMARRVL